MKNIDKRKQLHKQLVVNYFLTKVIQAYEWRAKNGLSDSFVGNQDKQFTNCVLGLKNTQIVKDYDSTPCLLKDESVLTLQDIEGFCKENQNFSLKTIDLGNTKEILITFDGNPVTKKKLNENEREEEVGLMLDFILSQTAKKGDFVYKTKFTKTGKLLVNGNSVYLTDWTKISRDDIEQYLGMEVAEEIELSLMYEQELKKYWMNRYNNEIQNAVLYGDTAWFKANQHQLQIEWLEEIADESFFDVEIEDGIVTLKRNPL